MQQFIDIIRKLSSVKMMFNLIMLSQKQKIVCYCLQVQGLENCNGKCQEKPVAGHLDSVGQMYGMPVKMMIDCVSICKD